MSTTTQNVPVPSTLAPTAPSAPKTRKYGEYDGRYKMLAREVFHDATSIFGLSEKAADKAAIAVMREYGQIMASQTVGKASVKFGKVDKDNLVNIREAAMTVKKCYQTPGITFLRVIAYIDSAPLNGIDRAGTKWQVDETVAKWLAELES